MRLFETLDRAFASSVAELNYTNPFTAERLELERRALGAEFEEERYAFWALMRDGPDGGRGNVRKITQRAERIAEAARDRMLSGNRFTTDELIIYDDLVLYLLFYSFMETWRALYAGDDAKSAGDHWERFGRQYDHWLNLADVKLPSRQDKPHVFAMLYQIFRAFSNIFDCVIGHSSAAARLRSQIWQSIFTHDLRRYRRTLYRNLHEVTTLVTGPSGSGKELVAQAIGRSRYIPYSVKKQQFEAAARESYVAVNISAFAVNLIESELFGYSKGAFTGAEGARAGWLEICTRYGTILLDEIGELDPTTQAKLLRVLQQRQFQRLGESKSREFHGKIMAATNRDLRLEIRKGTFREDLYYRLCADVVTTPALAEHLRDDPSTLEELVAFIAKRIAPGEEGALSQQVMDWINQHLQPDYPWPGNIRELEQCVRNIMIRNHYEPAIRVAANERGDPAAQLAQQIRNVELSSDALLNKYAWIAYQQSASYKRAAELLGIDRRTVRARCAAIDATLR